MTPPIPLRVIVIDDSHEVADLIVTYALRLGHEGVSAYTAKSGRELLHRGQFHLALVDVNLDDESGFELLSEFKSRIPEMQFIMISGDQGPESPVRAMRMGAAGYLIKPFTKDAFHAEFDRVTEERDALLQKRDNLQKLQRDLRKKTQEFLTEVGTSFNLQKLLIASLCNLTKTRDRDTGDHLHRIVFYTREIAMALRSNPVHAGTIDEAFISHLLLASPLHDIGKTGIPDAILLKPAKLTDDEFEIMKKHTIIGKEVLEEVMNGFEGNSPDVVRFGMDVCAYHHERWDGSGYTEGLSGEDIPLSARIVALADYYDALASGRCYRPQPMEHEVITDMIRKESGRHFDPDVVKAFFAAEPRIIEMRTAGSMRELKTIVHDPVLDSLESLSG